MDEFEEEEQIEDHLLNVSIDYRQVQDILSELFFKIDELNKKIIEINEKNEFDKLEQKIEKLSEQIDRINSAPEVQKADPMLIEENIYDEMDKRINNLKKEIEVNNQKTKNEISNHVNDQISQSTKTIDNLKKQYISLDRYNTLLSRINKLEGGTPQDVKISTNPVTIREVNQSLDPTSITDSIEHIKNRINEMDKIQTSNSKRIQSVESIVCNLINEKDVDHLNDQQNEQIPKSKNEQNFKQKSDQSTKQKNEQTPKHLKTTAQKSSFKSSPKTHHNQKQIINVNESSTKNINKGQSNQFDQFQAEIQMLKEAQKELQQQIMKQNKLITELTKNNINSSSSSSFGKYINNETKSNSNSHSFNHRFNTNNNKNNNNNYDGGKTIIYRLSPPPNVPKDKNEENEEEIVKDDNDKNSKIENIKNENNIKNDNLNNFRNENFQNVKNEKGKITEKDNTKQLNNNIEINNKKEINNIENNQQYNNQNEGNDKQIETTQSKNKMIPKIILDVPNIKIADDRLDRDRKPLNNENETHCNEGNNIINANIDEINKIEETINWILDEIEDLGNKTEKLMKFTHMGKGDETLREMLNQVRFEFNQRLLGLTPKEVEDMTSFAPLAVVKQVSKNFQSSIDGVEKQISMLKDFLKNLVSRNDLQAMMEKLNSIEIGNANETAGGRLGISCLLCGRPVQKVTGMITEGDVARLLGTPPGSIAGISRGSNKYVLVYGNEVMKNSKAKKKTQLPPIQKPPNGGPSPHEK